MSMLKGNTNGTRPYGSCPPHSITPARVLSAILILFALLATPAAFATSATWSGATSALWSDVNNWVDVPATPPGSGETATFNAASANTIIDLTGAGTNRTTFFDTASAAAYTIGAGGAGVQTLTLSTSGGGIGVNSTVANSQVFDANLDLGTAAGNKTFNITNNSTSAGLTLNGAISTAQTGTSTINVYGAGTTTINGQISNGAGTVGLIKTNAGVLVLNGTNSHTGNTIVRQGTLVIGDLNAVATSTIQFTGYAYGNNPTVIFRTDGGDVAGPAIGISGSSSTDWTLASDVKTGSVGTNYTLLGTVNIGSGVPPLIMNIIRGPNVVSGDPSITVPQLNLNGGLGGAASTTIINPTTANLIITNVALFVGGAQSPPRGKFLQLDGTSAGNQIVGDITDTAGSPLYGLIKTNISTWTLSGPNYCSGPTVVGLGTLVMTGSASTLSTNISVRSGATLDITGLTAGQLTLGFDQTLGGNGLVSGNVDGSVGTIAPGTATAGTLTISNLTMNGGGYLHFDIGNVTNVGGAFNDYLVIPGTLTVGGSTTLNVGFLNGFAASSGKYTLVSYGAYSGPVDISTAITVPPGYIITNNASAKTIELVPPAHTPISLTWVGNNGGIWDTITANWDSPDNLFYNGDSPRFDDTAITTGSIFVNGSISAANITVSNSVAYGFNSGTVAAFGLVKQGSGTLTLENDVTVSSDPLISGGTLQIGNGSTTGALNVGGITNNGTLAFNRSDDHTINTVISGTGSVSVIGAGTTRLAASNSYSGLTTVSSGTLRLENNSALGSTAAGTVIEGNGRISTLASRTIDESITLNPIDTSVPSLYVGGVQTFVINGAVTVNSNAAVQADGGSTLVFSNTVSGAGGLRKVINGTVVLAVSNSFSGGLSNTSGTLVLANDNAMGNNSQIVVSSTLGGAGLSGTRVTLSGGVTIAADKSVNLPSAAAGLIRSALFGTGSGVTNTWAGTVMVTGDGFDGNQVGIGVDAGSTFIITGAITTDGTFPNGTMGIRGGAGVGIIAGTVTLPADARIGVFDGATWIISSTGNTWGTNQIANGTLRLGANNALPTTSVITGAGTGTFDLAGFDQSIAGLDAGFAINNSSAVADSTLTYANAETNIYTGTMQDGVRKLNLTISSGTLELTSASSLAIPSSTISVGAAGVLNLNYTGTNTVAGLVTNGLPAGPGFYDSANSAPYLAGTGVIEVVASGPSGPATLTNSYSGGVLSLSWPTGQGWKLQQQTNSLATGLSTNWVYVTDGSISSTNITTDPTKGAVFYRLVYP